MDFLVTKLFLWISRKYVSNKRCASTFSIFKHSNLTGLVPLNYCVILNPFNSTSFNGYVRLVCNRRSGTYVLSVSAIERRFKYFKKFDQNHKCFFLMKECVMLATNRMSCFHPHFSFLHSSQPLLAIFLSHVWL